MRRAFAVPYHHTATATAALCASLQPAIVPYSRVLRSCVAIWAPYDSFYRINTNLTTMHAQFVSLDAELNEKVLDEFWIHRTPAQQ